MFDYETNKNSLRAHMSGTFHGRIPYNTKTQIFTKQSIKLFLKLRYVVVIPMLFKLVPFKTGVNVLIFKLLFLKARLTSVASQAAEKKSRHFVCARVLIMPKILPSKDGQCNTVKSP